MKIFFIVSSLNAGGAQRVISLMANYWADLNHNLTILTISNDKIFYDFDPKINIIKLGLDGSPGSIISGLKANITRIKAIRGELISVKPDIVISFLTQTNIIATIACKSLGTPIIISERNNPSKEDSSKIWEIARYITYRSSDLLVVQTEHVKQFFNNFGVNIEIIPNPVRTINIINAKKEKIILAAGRLTHQKGFDLLIKAFAEISSKEWRLIILGDGPERENLNRQLSGSGLENRVQMPGLVKDIDTFFSQASIFVLSSRFEGFPNVLCEAMAAGLPCISFDCNTGPSDIIDQNINGILVENENKNELSNTIRDLINNAEKRNKLGKEAEKITSSLDLEKIMAQWEKAVLKVIERRKH
jgi:GalNAc-alpha-(1->4)-GalNAc-alpha-(1->3)-diNAcBac-PP-undecaprenol alpha-1,4-N-acetyl-D-galactosaminyltransferase